MLDWSPRVSKVKVRGRQYFRGTVPKMSCISLPYGVSSFVAGPWQLPVAFTPLAWQVISRAGFCNEMDY